MNRPKFALAALRAAGNLLLVDADPVELVRSGYNAISRAYRTWLHQAGLEVASQQFVPEGDGGHALFWARLKPDGSP